MSNLYDCIIIGGGPSGLAAGIYSARARIKNCFFLKKEGFGGQISITDEIANYPGFYEASEEGRHPKIL